MISSNGLVTLEGFSNHPDDSEPDPGDWIQFHINVKNNSNLVTATIKAKVYYLDGLAWAMLSVYEFPDIALRESDTSDYFKIQISKTCPRDTVLAFGVDISSFDHVIRTDTIFIPIEADSTSVYC